jgi:glutathione S-transferase
MIKIYAGTAPIPQLKGFIRDLRPVWLLEELHVPYEIEYINAREDVNQPWFLAMNPFGKIPVLKDGDLTMFESGAICQYLADKYGKLIPKQGTRERLTHDQWFFASIANFEFNTVRLFALDIFYEPGPETDTLRKNANQFLESWLVALDRRLGEVPYLTGRDFQLCDLFLTTILRYPVEKKYFDKYANICAWVDKNTTRPAFVTAREKNGGAANTF